MHIYKPSKRPLIIIYILLFLILLLIRYAVNLISRFIPFSVDFILMPLWIAAAFFSIFILPIYFVKSFFSVSAGEIFTQTGMVVYTKQFMLSTSVKSVTTIVTPFGKYTGLNFVVLNALGSRLIMPFLTKKDALEITAIINRSIRSRK